MRSLALHSRPRIFSIRRLALITTLILLTLACTLPGVSIIDTQATSVAMGVQATQVAARATELEIQRQLAAATTPTSPPAPTVDLAQTEQALQSTAQVLEQTRAAPVLPSDPPTIQASSTSPAPATSTTITEWEAQYWVLLSSGCEIKDAPCWKLLDDFKTTQGPAEAFLTSKEAVLVGEYWDRPALVFLNKRDLKFEAKITLFIDGKPSVVRNIPRGTVGSWKEEAIDLSPYIGKYVRVQFSCPVGMRYINSWFLQNIQFVPQYDPEF